MGLVGQRVLIFLETLVKFLKIKWDVFKKHMNFNLVWFLPTVSFRALRMSLCSVFPPGLENARLPFLPSQHKLLDFVVLRSTGFVFLLLLTYVRPPDVVKRSRNTKPVGLFATKLKQFVLRR